ncbi:MAG: hypothetical protein GY730_11510 [bacterium]|nr:hypothetical protein [bacterium]
MNLNLNIRSLVLLIIILLSNISFASTITNDTGYMEKTEKIERFADKLIKIKDYESLVNVKEISEKRGLVSKSAKILALKSKALSSINEISFPSNEGWSISILDSDFENEKIINIRTAIKNFSANSEYKASPGFIVISKKHIVRDWIYDDGSILHFKGVVIQEYPKSKKSQSTSQLVFYGEMKTFVPDKPSENLYINNVKIISSTIINNKFELITNINTTGTVQYSNYLGDWERITDITEALRVVNSDEGRFTNNNDSKKIIRALKNECIIKLKNEEKVIGKIKFKDNFSKTEITVM